MVWYGMFVGVVCAILLNFPTGVLATERKTVPVPPGLEIEILDPGVDPIGNPAVLPQASRGGERGVAIPPTVLVHRYYYTGDRNFQGPLLPGGPSVVVFNHPKTGERLYLDVQMLPGAPRVFYTSRSIEYDYGEQRIVIGFNLCGKPTVTFHNCASASHKRAAAARQRAIDGTKKPTSAASRDASVKRAQKKSAKDDLTIPTNR
ncbi:MAG: hypothetical protein ACKV0T_22235 [Planctomycetales bacterium]